MVTNKFIDLVLVTLLTSCGTNKVITETVPVYIPVAKEVSVVKPTRPELVIYTLSEKDKEDYALVAKAYVASLSQAMLYAGVLEEVVEALTKGDNNEE